MCNGQERCNVLRACVCTVWASSLEPATHCPGRANHFLRPISGSRSLTRWMQSPPLLHLHLHLVRRPTTRCLSADCRTDSQQVRGPAGVVGGQRPIPSVSVVVFFFHRPIPCVLCELWPRAQCGSRDGPNYRSVCQSPPQPHWLVLTLSLSVCVCVCVCPCVCVCVCSGRPRGFGFVVFHENSTMQRVLSQQQHWNKCKQVRRCVCLFPRSLAQKTDGDISCVSGFVQGRRSWWRQVGWGWPFDDRGRQSRCVEYLLMSRCVGMSYVCVGVVWVCVPGDHGPTHPQVATSACPR